METKNLNLIMEQLEKERVLLSGKAERLRTELAAVDTDVMRIQAAQAALSDSPSSSPNGKSFKKRKLTNPSASKSQVIALVADELSKNENLQEEELKKRVEQRLIDSGHTRIGFALRFKEALADSNCGRNARV